MGGDDDYGDAPWPRFPYQEVRRVIASEREEPQAGGSRRPMSEMARHQVLALRIVHDQARELSDARPPDNSTFWRSWLVPLFLAAIALVLGVGSFVVGDLGFGAGYLIVSGGVWVRLVRSRANWLNRWETHRRHADALATHLDRRTAVALLYADDSVALDHYRLLRLMADDRPLHAGEVLRG